MSKLRIENVSRIFPAVRGGVPTRALQPIDLTVGDNDFVTILGPSGCGKSTLLRLVAGLDTASTGRILLDGTAVTGPGSNRGMVFQSYTLFPWLTVADNVAFGLREKGVPAAERARVVQSWLTRVGLSSFARHYPKQLSGGMQ
jgi:ABC-type nitrate/sulfonate/bicarbonate transport system ATPase subunit